MVEFTGVDESLPFLDQEDQVLRYFKDNFTTNPKKLVKLAAKVATKCPPFIQRSIIHNVMTARYPVKYLQQAFKEMEDFPIIIEGLIADGNHGMIMDEENIWGICIEANPKWLRENDRWNKEDELDIMEDVMDKWLMKRCKKRFLGRILLFKEFGFSGMPRKVDQEFTKEFFDDMIADKVSQERLMSVLENG